MDDLFLKLRRSLPSGLNPDYAEDVVADLVILVLEGRIEQHDIPAGVKRFLPSIRKKYTIHDGVSLDQTVDTGDGGSLRLGDLIASAAPLAKHGCPNCRKRVRPKRTYCSPACAYVYYANQHRVIDPNELDHLHNVRRLPRKTTAEMLGVTVHGVNSVLARKKLYRKKTPDTCVKSGCERPAVHFKHSKGWTAGNLCLEHKREAQRRYQREYRLRRVTPATAEQRKEIARRASLARWAKHQTPEGRSAEVMKSVKARRKKRTEMSLQSETLEHTVRRL